MTPHDDFEPTMRTVARLRPLVPDPARAERVRARCHAQLRLGQRRADRTARVAGAGRRVLAPVVVGGLCVLYVVALVGTAIRLRGGVSW